MTTHRSLNKLEFKAHMSIHNKVEVSDAGAHEASHTRDRFGKKHRISESDGAPRIRRRKKVIVLLFAVSLTGCLFTGKTAWGLESAHRSTDVKVESSSMNEALINEKINNVPGPGSAIYKDEDKAVGFNEDGDPNMSVRF